MSTDVLTSVFSPAPHQENDPDVQTHPRLGIALSLLAELFLVDEENGRLRNRGFRFKGRNGPVVGVPGAVASYLYAGKEYRTVKVKGKIMPEHVVIWALLHGRWPLNQIDHVNGDAFDNRPQNLREATNGQNRANSSASSKRSLPKGVQLREGRYVVQIKVNGRAKSFGGYSSLEEATSVARREHIKMHGEFSSYQRERLA